MSTRLKESVNRRSRRQSHFTKRTVFVISSSVAGGLFVSSFALAMSAPSTTAGSRKSAASVTASTPWTTPSNEVNAPMVPIPGGAVSGSGNFNAINCFNSSQCVAVGGDNDLDGVAALTSNAGSSWSESLVASGLPDLNAVDCPSATTCVAVGVAGTSTSTDGGATWLAHDIPSVDTTLLGV